MSFPTLVSLGRIRNSRCRSSSVLIFSPARRPRRRISTSARRSVSHRCNMAPARRFDKGGDHHTTRIAHSVSCFTSSTHVRSHSPAVRRPANRNQNTTLTPSSTSSSRSISVDLRCSRLTSLPTESGITSATHWYQHQVSLRGNRAPANPRLRFTSEKRSRSRLYAARLSGLNMH